MRIFYYFCCKFLFIAAIVFIAVGCSDIIEIEHDKDIIGGNGKGLSVIEAKEFFEKSIMSKSRTEQEPKDDKYYKERCMLPVGDFVPQWEEGISTDAPTLFSVDVPIKATYRYRVLRIDEKTQKVYTTTCYQELVVVKDLEGRMGYKVVLFIPDREYSIKNPGDVSRRLTNGIDMGDYSGLKIYTDIEGRMTRVNRFLNGKKTVGIDLTTPGTFNERLALYVRALKTIGKIFIQRQGSKTVMSRGEDDWYDDSWDDTWGSWWGDDYDDVSDANNDYYEYVETQSGDDIYYNHLDGNFYIDFGGNGHVDSCISDEVVIQPGDEEETTPPDDPIDDPEDAPVDDYHEWNDITDNSDITDSGNNGSGDNGDSGDDQYYIELGNQGINKITTDLKNGNVQIQQVKMSAGEAVLNASGIGLNANELITSCINFIKDTPPSAIAFGNAISVAGFAIGFSQTWIGYSDGDITTQDKLNLISTALSAAGIVCALIPWGQVASGILGVTSCVIGLVSTFVTSEVQREIHLNFEDGTSFHMYLIS